MPGCLSPAMRRSVGHAASSPAAGGNTSTALGTTRIGPRLPAAETASATSPLTQMRIAFRSRYRDWMLQSSACRTCWMRFRMGVRDEQPLRVATVRVLFSHRSELRVRGDYTHGHPTPRYPMRKCSWRSPGSRLTIRPTFTRCAHPRRREAARSITARSTQFIWRPTPTTVVTSLSALRHFDYALRVTPTLPS